MIYIDMDYFVSYKSYKYLHRYSPEWYCWEQNVPILEFTENTQIYSPS